MNITYIYIFVGFVALLWVVLVIFVLKLNSSLQKINESFNKLGFIAREDTKKYFDESSQKATAIYQESADVNKVIIEQTMEKVLKDSSSLVKETITEAEKDAAEILNQARFESINIKRTAQEEAAKKFENLIDDSVQAVDWAMEQFIKEKYSYKEHEEAINKLIDIYVNEHKKS
jgi:F0F1-type ATP synthase membrane subunit b/b'